MLDIIRTPEVAQYILIDDGTYPNNAQYPLIVYLGAFILNHNAADDIAGLFTANQWSGIWYNGVYSFHHYHSTAHEVLGIANGQGSVQFVGPAGPVLEVNAGDVVVVPAGVAHKKIFSNAGFLVIGGYPIGQSPDMNYGKPDERPQAVQNIKRVPIPVADPIYGEKGPLVKRWNCINKVP